jgi:tetratricopeptide (TPR) repeat protein
MSARDGVKRLQYVIALDPRRGASNVMRKPALWTCLLLGSATAAMGQSRQENVENCRSVDPDTRIAGCTARINAGQDTTENLSTIYNNRGTAYNSKGDHDHAIQDFSEAIRLSPSHGYTYRNRGIDYYEKGDYDRAIQDFNEAIHLDPNDTSTYFSRGDAYNSKRDYDRAIPDFNEAIRIKPNYARPYYGRGQAYYGKGDYDRAIPDFSEAIRLNPNDMSAYYERGLSYINKGDYDRAIQDFGEAIRLNPKFAYAYEKRGDAYLLQSNVTAAIANFKDAISAAPSSSLAVFAAVKLHVATMRQGHSDAQQLASVAAAADLSKWPGPLLKLDLGQMTATGVMVAAANADAYTEKSQLCVANYYTGEDALFHRDRTAALARLRAARDGCPSAATEYRAALLELKRLGALVAPTK